MAAIYKGSSIEIEFALTSDNLNTPPQGLTWGIIDYRLYVSFYCAWIAWQFHDSRDSTLEWRQKYGDNGWSNWKRLTP